MAIKISLTARKGGNQKTSTTACLADALQRRGKKVLVIDTDAQMSLTNLYSCDLDEKATLGDIMLCDTSAASCILHQPMGDIIPSDPRLVNADYEVKADINRFYHLSDACKSIENSYDFIICDCGPADGVLLGNVLSYVDYVIVPTTADRFGTYGLYSLPEIIQQYTNRINPSLKALGVLITRYKGRQNLTKDLVENTIPQLAADLGTTIFDTKIRDSVKIQEAQTMLVSLHDYAPQSTVAIDYENFTDEVLDRLKKER